MSLPFSEEPITREHVPPELWDDWRWQLRNMLTAARQFEQLVELSADERQGFDASAGLFRVGATPYYAGLMDPDHPSCPIRRQAIPSAREGEFAPEELRDPLGEDTHHPAPAVFHKYPDRILLLAVDRCAIYCRHCNRRRLVGGDAPPTRDDLSAGIDYIASERRIRDVLISGGDPFLLSTRRLESIVDRVRAIDHVEIIRVGTRIPVVLPMRVDDELCSMLRRYHPFFVNTHFNHPKEITPEAREACERLVDHGIPVGNQAVLMAGINSSVRCQRKLSRELLKMRVKPYYLFQGDTVIGTDHLRTPVKDAIRILDNMRGWITGMGIPHLVIDAPGGGGKIPIGPQYLIEMGEHAVVLRNYRGKVVSYPQPRASDCAVPYDEVYFRGQQDDDDREGSA